MLISHTNGKKKEDPSVILGGTCEPALTINKFSTDNQGEYYCVVKNSDKTSESNSAKMEHGKY